MWNILITISCITAAVLAKPAIFWSPNPSEMTMMDRFPNPPRPIDLPVTCPEGFDQRDKYCYYVSKGKANWNKADADCRARNSTLAKLPDQESVRYLRTYIQSPRFSERDYWIGARYDPMLSAWVWGTTGEKLTYHTFWKTKFKRDLDWTCAIMAKKRIHLWAPIRCYRRRHYICLTVLADEPPAVSTAPTTDHPTTRRIEETTLLPNSKPRENSRVPTKPQTIDPDSKGTNEKIRDLTKKDLIESIKRAPMAPKIKISNQNTVYGGYGHR